jgi:hypothetical protein
MLASIESQLAVARSNLWPAGAKDVETTPSRDAWKTLKSLGPIA